MARYWYFEIEFYRVLPSFFLFSGLYSFSRYRQQLGWLRRVLWEFTVMAVDYFTDFTEFYRVFFFWTR